MKRALILLALATSFHATADICSLANAQRDQTASVSCLSCHDGSIGSNIGVGHGYHPVGTDYADAMYRRPAAVLRISPPPELVLVNGKVECTTCHDGGSREPSFTALPMNRSALCFACHAR